MPIPGLDEYTIRSYITKFALLFGILLIIYALLWMLAELKIIPAALSNMLWVVVLGCDFFVQDITFVPSYCHVS